MESQKILTVKDLTVRELASQKQLLKAITFSVKRHQSLGIFGPSGSGKTTLLNTLARYLIPTMEVQGMISYHTEDGQFFLLQDDLKTAQILKLSRDIAYIPQNTVEIFDPIEKLGKQFQETLIENDFPLTIIPLMIEEMLAKLQLPMDTLTKYPFQLSGGMLQRCAIALALILQPKLILADEPTSSLDAINKKQVAQLLKNLQQQKQLTLVMATHDIALLDYLCDDALVLMDGQLITEDPLHQYSQMETSYLEQIRARKRKISAPFWRMKHEKLASH